MRSRLFVLIALIAPSLFSCAESGGIEAADLVACGVYDPKTHTCDRRDGQKYRIARGMPGGKLWMAENLNYKISNSYCYGNEEENCSTYGRLYSWDDREILCPEGWRIPDMKSDWEELQNEVGEDVDNYLKAKNGWAGNGNGEDKYHFTALPAGAYKVKYMGTDVDIFEDEDGCKGKTILGWSEDDDGGIKSLGRIAVFMGLSDQSKWIISNESALRFCVALDAYVSVRCVKE